MKSESLRKKIKYFSFLDLHSLQRAKYFPAFIHIFFFSNYIIFSRLFKKMKMIFNVWGGLLPREYFIFQGKAFGQGFAYFREVVGKTFLKTTQFIKSCANWVYPLQIALLMSLSFLPNQNPWFSWNTDVFNSTFDASQ